MEGSEALVVGRSMAAGAAQRVCDAEISLETTSA